MRLLTVVALLIASEIGCASSATSTPAPAPKPQITPETAAITHQLEVIADPPEAADFLLNPQPLGQGGYLSGRTVRIDVLPKEGWKVAEWVGPVYSVSGRTAKIDMKATQTVVVRLVRLAVPTATPIPIPTTTSTPFPTHMPSSAPTPTDLPTPSAVPTYTPPPTNAPLPMATPRPTATLTPVPTATSTSTPTPTQVPTPAPIPRYQLFINGFPAPSSSGLMLVTGKTVTLSQATDADGKYAVYTKVTMVASSSPGSEVTWGGVDSQSGAFGTVEMVTDHFVTSNVRQSTPVAPTSTPIPPGAGSYLLLVYPRVGQTSQVFAGKAVTFNVGGDAAKETAIWQGSEAELLDLSANSRRTGVSPGTAPLIHKSFQYLF